MQGFPPFRAFLVFLLMACCGYPIHQLVNERDQVSRHSALTVSDSSDPSQPSSPTLSTRLIWKASHEPLWISVSQEGTVIWKGAAQDLPECDLRFDTQDGPPSLDLVVEAEWPDGTPEAALELTVEPQGLEEKSHTFWGSHTLNEEHFWQWTP